MTPEEIQEERKASRARQDKKEEERMAKHREMNGPPRPREFHKFRVHYPRIDFSNDYLEPADLLSYRMPRRKGRTR